MPPAPPSSDTTDTTPDFISQQVTESDYFFLDLNPSKDRGFNVTCGGLEYCNADYKFDRAKFDYYAMEYIVSGHCNLMLGNQHYDLKAGSIFCYGPRTHHRIRNTGSGPLIKFFVDFTGSDVRQVIGEPFLKSPTPYQMPNLKGMYSIFEQILETGKQGGLGCQRILRQYIELIALLTKFKAVDLHIASSRSYQTYAHCLSIIEHQYSSLQSVDSLAKSCHITTGHLSRIFRRFSDESPWQMILRLKMNRAAELFLSDRRMVKDVAFNVGFTDVYHFSRVFKQFYGMAPKFFREKMMTGGVNRRAEK